MSVSWMLLKKSGRQSVVRLGLTAAAVALGIMLVCYFVAGTNGLLGRSNRVVIGSIAADASNNTDSQKPIKGVDPLKVMAWQPGNTSKWRDQSISVYSMYGTDKSPQFAKMKTPRPGEYYLSRALAELVADYPEDNILARFGKNTKYLGLIPDEYVETSDTLMMVRGIDSQEVAQADTLAKSRQQPSAFADIYKTDKEGKKTVSFDPFSVMILGVGATILLFPVVIFVSVATQLGAAQREKRYAALRLIGATKKQVARVLMLESFWRRRSVC